MLEQVDFLSRLFLALSSRSVFAQSLANVHLASRRFKWNALAGSNGSRLNDNCSDRLALAQLMSSSSSLLLVLVASVSSIEDALTVCQSRPACLSARSPARLPEIGRSNR